MGVSSWSTTAGSNTTVGGISIAEGMSPAGVNDGMRAIMADGRARFDELPAVTDSGAVGDGTTDDTTAVQNADNAASGKPLIITKRHKVTAFENLLGSRFIGPGSLQIAAGVGGIYQHSHQTYAADAPRSAFKLNLYRIFARLRVGGTLKMFLYGDSTVATVANGGVYTAGGAASQMEPHALMKKMLERKGVRTAISITNRGVGGTKFSDLSAISDIDTVTGSTDAFIIKYGINDVRTESGDITTDLMNFANTVDSKMSAIRTSSGYGSVDNLSIILVGPTNTWDPQHGRTNIWYERLRGVLLAAAIKYNCFYYDPYQMMPGNIGWIAGKVAGFSDDFSNGQPIHPGEIPLSQWMGGLVDEMIGFSDLALYDNNTPVALTLANSWTNYAGFASATYSMDRDGRVTLDGMIAPGTLTAGTTLTTLPSGFRPASNVMRMAAVSGGAQANIRVMTTGDVQLVDTLSGITYLSLGNVIFPTR